MQSGSKADTEYNIEVRELYQQIGARDKRIIELERQLDEVTPLRRHIVKQVWISAVKIDRKLIYLMRGINKYKPKAVKVTHDDQAAAYLNDQLNFSLYNDKAKNPFVLRMYLFFRNTSARIVKRALAWRRRRRISR